MKSYATIKTDLLIIGAGGAGLRAAIEAKTLGLDTLLVTKEPMGEAHTTKAMGGLNVAMKAPATPQQHYDDTIKGGWYINNHKLVHIFTTEMPERIYDLERYGTRFDRLPDGTFYTWAGGKHSAPLNLCAGDYTGREMMKGLVAEIKRLQIPYLPHRFITKLFVKGLAIVGALALDMNSNTYVFIHAKAILLAAGGGGQMYRITSNEPANTAEGYAWALDVGAELVDMEMVQIHPTGVAYPESIRGQLVTEKVRGHFGILKNKEGERFMLRYQPERKELAGRDEVTRAIHQEITEGRGTKHGGVYLDTTHWEKGKAEKTIPEVFALFKSVSIDIRREMMEISPTMHHMMGGLKINEWGESNIPGFYAAGEVAGGIHGANRLGGNSLAEGQVMGRRAAIGASRYIKTHKYTPVSSEPVREEIDRIEHMVVWRGTSAKDIRSDLKDVMWKQVGILRSQKSLDQALKKIKKLQKQAELIHVEDKKELPFALETQEMLKTAEAIVVAALARKESRGAHFRTDYPDMKKQWEKNILVYQKDGKLKTKVVPVVKE